MTARREFTAKIKLEAWARCKGRCERCKEKIVGSRAPPQYDHSTPEAVADKSKPLSVDDCNVLCLDCHFLKTFRRAWGPASRGDVTEIAKTKRIQAKQAGKQRKGRPMPGTKASGWRKRMDGRVERRDK
jgi:HNH endonuclease